MYLDAADGAAGQAAFELLGLRGHPAVVVFDARGNEILRMFGSVEESLLREVLDDF